MRPIIASISLRSTFDLTRPTLVVTLRSSPHERGRYGYLPLDCFCPSFRFSTLQFLGQVATNHVGTAEGRCPHVVRGNSLHERGARAHIVLLLLHYIVHARLQVAGCRLALRLVDQIVGLRRILHPIVKLIAHGFVRDELPLRRYQ